MEETFAQPEDMGWRLACIAAVRRSRSNAAQFWADFTNAERSVCFDDSGGHCQHPDTTVDAEIEQSLDSQLSTKGLTRTDTNADLIIDYQIAITKAEKWVNDEDRGGSWNDFGVTSAPTKTIIKIGPSVLEIYEIAGTRLIWTGTVIKGLNTGSTRIQEEQTRQGSRSASKRRSTQ